MRTRILMMTTVVLALVSCGATAEAAQYNVRSAPYNAVGDGVADDTVAVQAALTAAAANPAGGGEVYFPAGIYRLTNSIGVSTGAVTLRGDGQRSSTLRWEGLPNGSLGFVFSYPSSPVTPYNTLTIRGLSFIRKDGTGGTAIWAYWPSSTGGARYLAGGGVTALLEDFHVGAEGVAYWHTGVFMGRAIAAKIATFNIQGVPNSSDYGVRLSNAVGATVHDGNITGFKAGVVAEDATEDLHVQQVAIRGADKGIEIVNGGRGNTIASNQIWSRNYGIHLSNGVGDTGVVDNQIVRLDEVSHVGIDVHGPNVKRARIIGNTIYAAPAVSTLPMGIRVWDGPDDLVIEGNITENMWYGIWLVLNQNVSGNIVFGNINRNAVVAIVNDGINTKCQTNVPAC